MTDLLQPPLSSHSLISALNFSTLGLIYKFQTLYVLYNSDTIKKSWLNGNIDEMFNVQPSYFAKRPFTITDVSSSSRSLHEMGGFSDNPLMVIIAVHPFDPVFLKLNEFLRGKKCISVVILLKENYDFRNLETLFKYLFKKQFRRVLALLTNDGHLYTMKPYPLVEMVNVTGKSVQDYFPFEWKRDLKGYRIQVPVQIDVPNTFWYYDDRYKRIRIDGTGGKFFENFMKAMNVTMDIYPLYVNNSNHLNMNYIQELLLNESIEISPHMYNTLDRKSSNDYSYAYITTSRCMLLPTEDFNMFEISNVYIFHEALLFLIILLIVISELIVQLLIRYHPDFRNKSIYHRYNLPGTVAFYMICVLINIPMPDIRFFNVHKVPLRRYLRIILLYVVISFGGFCFSQMYSSSLTSRLTVSVPIKPKTTPEQIISMKKHIMATEQTRKIFLRDTTSGRKLVPKMIFTSPEIFNINRINMNMSYIYPVSSARWDIIRQQQLFLKTPRFWQSDVCVGTYPLQYQMRLDSPFKPFMRRFIMYTLEAGLLSHWKSHVFYRAKTFGHMRYFKDDETNLKRSHTHKKFILTFKYVGISVYFCGVLLSSIAFVSELIYKKMFGVQCARGIICC